MSRNARTFLFALGALALAGGTVLTDDRTAMDVWADRVNRAARRELHDFFGPHGGSW